MTLMQTARTRRRASPIVPVILCGGSGSRLWPMSRAQFPKQFLGLNTSGGASLLEQTAKRVGKNGSHPMRPPVIVSNIDHRFLVADHMQRAGCGEMHILLEPVGRNTAPAITAAALYAQSLYKNALLLVLPSDHIIRDLACFAEAVGAAVDAAADGHLVTFGIAPEYPETGYGYIRQGKALEPGGKAFSVSQFVEKPDAGKAVEYLAAGDYSWNSGMFVFPADAFLKEIGTHEPIILKEVKAALDHAEHDADFIRLEEKHFAKAPAISVDYAVMERTKKAAVVPVACGWSDAGAWDSLWRIGEKDENGNVIGGTAYLQDTRDSYVHVEGGAPVATLGIEDLVVVSTKDAVLVTRRDRAQDIKQLMEAVKAQNRQLVEHHQRVHRPWGFYETVEMGERHQVKHIRVRPGAKLSVQMHHHRAEHWVITAGTARVTVDGEEKTLSENQYVFIPLGAVHCIENIGKIPLDFIEVQQGSYLGEDDIVRFSDIYGRAGTKG